ncbi:MAG: hypothetical protein ACYDAR_17030 [Thermomicrobiales bacterium]
MTKRESDDAMKAAEYNIDAAFDVLRTALANPKGLEHIPNGSSVVVIPVDGENPEVTAANRILIDNLTAQGQQVTTLRVIVAQVTIAPDGGIFIGQTYFTPDEAMEVKAMIDLGERPMPGTIGMEFTSDGHVVALRPLFNGPAAKKVHPLVLEDHPEIPHTDRDSASHAPAATFEKLNEVVKPVLAM